MVISISNTIGGQNSTTPSDIGAVGTFGSSIPSSTNVAGTANFSMVSGKLRYAPLTNNLVRLTSLNLPWKNGRIEMLFKVCPVTGLTAATFGFRVGLFSTAPAAYGPSSLGNIAGGLRTTNTNPGNRYLTYTDNVGAAISSSADGVNLNLTTGDEVKLVYTFNYNNNSIEVTKTSSGLSYSRSGVFNSNDNVLGVVPGAWNVYLSGQGGEYDIEYINVYSTDKSENDVIMIGDSITHRSVASTFSAAYAYTVKNSVANGMVMGFPSYTSADILPHIDAIIASQINKPVIFLLIGTNDANGNNGATTDTWRTNYLAIINKFIVAGWPASKIVLGKVPPRAAGAANTAVNTINGYMQTDYAGIYEIRAINALLQVGGVATTLNFNADLIHPNDVGHNIIATDLLTYLHTRGDISFK